MTDLEIRALRDDDEPAVLALLQASLAGGPTGERTSAFFGWKHRQSPFGASPGLVACADGRVVGVRLLLRWRLQLGEHTVHAVRMVDTATAPDWQGRGIFRTLTLQAVAEASARGQADLVFNTPNAQSRPGYLRMGWGTVGRLPVSLRATRPDRLVRAVATGRVGQQAVTGAPEPVRSPLPTARTLLDERTGEVDDLLAEAAGARDPGRLTTARTPAYVRWRYAQAPGLDYRAVPVEVGGRLVGLGLGRLRRRGAVTELTLGEVLVRPGDRAATRAVLHAASRAGTDVVTALLPGGVGGRSGYLTLPRQGLTLTARPQGDLPVDVLRPAAWQLTLGDLEVF